MVHNDFCEMIKLQVDVTDEMINEIVKRYHFQGEDVLLIRSLSESVIPLVKPRAYLYMKKSGEVVKYEEYAECLVTLGKAFDDFQELYVENQCLTEAYMLECIGLTLLSEAYEGLVKEIQIRYGKWATKMDFFGDEYPVSLMTEVMKGFSESGVSISEELVLKPLKSVLFLLPLSDKDTGAKPCLVCNNCGNLNCMFRRAAELEKYRERHAEKIREAKAKEKKQLEAAGAMSYGIMQIFKH